MDEIVQGEKKAKVKDPKKVAQSSTQLHLRISEIRNDTVVLKSGGIRAVLGTSSINFNLKSETEQTAIITAFQSFLNTLDFPIQILAQSKKLDLDNYLMDLKATGEKQENPLLKKQTFEYVEYIQRLLQYADIMDKSFYVVIPYESFSAQKTNIFSKFLQRFKMKETGSEFAKHKKEFDQLKKGLEHRVNNVIAGLENCGLKANRLGTKELVELYYKSYNPETSRGQKVKDFEQQDLS